MDRRGEHEKAKAEAKRPPASKSPKDDSDKPRDLEKRLAEAQQSATAEILGVISQSPTDFQPVFETILAQALHLCAAEYAAVFRFDGSMLHFVESYNLPARDL